MCFVLHKETQSNPQNMRNRYYYDVIFQMRKLGLKEGRWLRSHKQCRNQESESGLAHVKSESMYLTPRGL